MVNANDLKSTESITRFLRNKDSQIEEIYEFVTKNIFASDQNQGNFYLPQKEKFILELLVDRLTQTSKQAQSFKFNSTTWKLFNLVSKSCETDFRLINIRANVLTKIKFGETFSKLLSEIYNQGLFKDSDLIEEITKLMKSLLQTSNTHISDEQSVRIVSHLLNFAAQSNNYSADLIKSVVELALDIFKLNNRGSLKYDSKHRSECTRTCIVNVLLLSRKEELETLKHSLKSMVIKVLFAELKSGTSINIVTYIQQLLKATNISLLQTEDLLYLTQIIITKVDLNELEETVKLLVEKFPDSSSALIEEIASMNKTLSTEFLSSLVEKALNSFSVQSYQLIRYAMKRSSDITFKYADGICELCSVPNENSHVLFQDLFDSYMRNRELEKFVKLWAKLVQQYPNGIFSSDNILDYVASKLLTVSHTQLLKLAESEIEVYKSSPESEPVFLLAVAKCFSMGVSGSVQNSLNRTLVLNLHEIKPYLISLLHVEGVLSWKLKFYIATLFDLEDIMEHVEAVKNQPIIASNYFFFLHLRIMEQDIDNVNQTIIDKIKDYYLKEADNDFKFTMFSRFFMIVERVYSKKDIKEMLRQLMEARLDLTALFENPLFQAQPQIVSSTIDLCIENEKYYQFLKLISVYAFTKSQREMTLNIALTRLEEDSTGLIIKHLIQMPTYKSKLETEFDALLQLVRNDNIIYVEIAEEILMLHMKRSSESTNYLQALYDSILKIFGILTAENYLKYKDHIKLTLLVLKNHNDIKSSEVANTAISQILKLLKKPKRLEENYVVFLVKFITELNFLGVYKVDPSSVKQIISTISDEFINRKPIEDTLFGLACSSQKSYSAEHILALFIVLEIESIHYLKKFIETLSDDRERYIQVWNNLSESIQYANKEDLKKYIIIYGIFLTYTQKHEGTEYILKAHKLFVASLSNIFRKIKEFHLVTTEIIDFINSLKLVLSAKAWLITQYAMEQILVLASEVSVILSLQEEDTFSEIFVSLCQVVASIILYHRKRLSNRQHLIISVFISLMRTLFMKSKLLSSECAAAFERLTSNFCEPTINQISIKHNEHIVTKDDELNEALSSTKQNLRKNIPILLFSYIKLYLQYPVDLSMKSHIDNSVYMMLDLLTLNELNYINQSLDNQGLVVFKNIYENYKQFYKWNEE